MDPRTLIEEDLLSQQLATTAKAWTDQIRPTDKPSPFRAFDLYYVNGSRGQFDFPALPSGSYCIYAANGKNAIRLTRERKEIQLILRQEWDGLATADPVVLSAVILRFFDGGIRASHYVLRDIADLRRFAQVGYVLNERRLSRVEGLIGSTSMQVDSEEMKLRTLTLMGWMHHKRNLGIEMIHISKDGVVRLDKRKTLTRRVFKRTPSTTTPLGLKKTRSAGR